MRHSLVQTVEPRGHPIGVSIANLPLFTYRHRTHHPGRTRANIKTRVRKITWNQCSNKRWLDNKLACFSSPFNKHKRERRFLFDKRPSGETEKSMEPTHTPEMHSRTNDAKIGRPLRHSAQRRLPRTCVSAPRITPA